MSKTDGLRPLWEVVARSTFLSEKREKPSGSDHFWNLRCRKSARRRGAKCPSQNVQNTPLAPSTCPSQNVHNTSGSDRFWKLRCRNSARCCGAKRVSKLRSTRHIGVGPLWEIEVSKQCAPLWREAQLEAQNGQN